jgi:hypothetical protein
MSFVPPKWLLASHSNTCMLAVADRPERSAPTGGAGRARRSPRPPGDCCGRHLNLIAFRPALVCLQFRSGHCLSACAINVLTKKKACAINGWGHAHAHRMWEARRHVGPRAGYWGGRVLGADDRTAYAIWPLFTSRIGSVRFGTVCYSVAIRLYLVKIVQNLIN